MNSKAYNSQKILMRLIGIKKDLYKRSKIKHSVDRAGLLRPQGHLSLLMQFSIRKLFLIYQNRNLLIVLELMVTKAAMEGLWEMPMIIFLITILTRKRIILIGELISNATKRNREKVNLELKDVGRFN